MTCYLGYVADSDEEGKGLEMLPSTATAPFLMRCI